MNTCNFTNVSTPPRVCSWDVFNIFRTVKFNLTNLAIIKLCSKHGDIIVLVLLYLHALNKVIEKKKASSVVYGIYGSIYGLTWLIR